MFCIKKYSNVHNKIGDRMYINIILKTVLLYFFIILSYRIMGKKEVGKLSIIDLIVSVLIAELAAMSIEEENRSIFISLVPIIVLVVIQIGLSYVTLKNKKIREIIDGHPSIIIKDGKVNFSIMSKLRYSLDDLMVQLREQGIKSIEEVNYAILENNGKLSVLKDATDYPLPLIIEGKVQNDVLVEIKKDYNWINKMLKSKNLKLENIYYAFYTKNKTYIITNKDLL